MTITTEILKHSLPDKFKNSVNDELLNNINNTLSDPDLYETYRDNFLSYMSVLNDGRYKITDYLNAVKYCTQRLMGKSQIDSYIVTFPDRYNTMIQNGKSSKDISSIVTVYNKSKLVNAIMEQSLIPSYILNQDLYQKAINVQAELMNTATSEKVRSDAANSLLTHLKPPETKKVELDIGLKQGSEVDSLRSIIAELAGERKRMIEAGVVSVKETAEAKLVGQVIEHDPTN